MYFVELAFGSPCLARRMSWSNASRRWSCSPVFTSSPVGTSCVIFWRFRKAAAPSASTDVRFPIVNGLCGFVQRQLQSISIARSLRYFGIFWDTAGIYRLAFFQDRQAWQGYLMLLTISATLRIYLYSSCAKRTSTHSSATLAPPAPHTWHYNLTHALALLTASPLASY